MTRRDAWLQPWRRCWRCGEQVRPEDDSLMTARGSVLCYPCHVEMVMGVGTLGLRDRDPDAETGREGQR